MEQLPRESVSISHRPTTSSQLKESLMMEMDDNLPMLGHRGYICCCIPSSWVLRPERPDAISNSNLATIVLLLNTMIGSGILVQGYVFRESGIITAIFLYLILGFLIYQGARVLVVMADHKQIFDYSTLTHEILGKQGSLAVDLAIIINNTGALLSYILIIGTLLDDVVSTFSNCSDWYCNVGFLTVLPVFSCTVPLCLIREFGHLAIVSYLSILVISAVVLLVIIGGPIRREYYVDDDGVSATGGSFLGVVRTVGDIVFALGFVTGVFPAYRAMADQRIYNFNSCIFTTTACGVALCFFTGLAAYLSFGNGTETNVLENFPGPLGAVFKLFVIIHLVLYIPGDFVILRTSLWKLFGTNASTQSDASFILTSLSLIFLVTSVAVLLEVCLPNQNVLNDVINVTGGLAGCTLYFVVPGLCAQRLMPSLPSLRHISALLLCFGLIIALLVIVGCAI